MPELTRIDAVASALRARFGPPPPLAVVLGSGMGRFAEALAERDVALAASLGLPAPAVPGHRGELVLGSVGGRRVLALSGRLHCYEGYDAPTVALAVRSLGRWGVRGLVLTSAVGGLHAAMAPGTIVCIRDHLNLLGQTPLRGPNLDVLGPRFPDLSQLYTPARRALAQRAAAELGVGPLREGVYAAMPGPSYETPAEIRMLQVLGADVVGMSVVPEAVAAGHMGMELLALSVVSNPAAGLGDEPLRHEDVTAAMAAAGERVVRLLQQIAVSW